MTMMVVNASTVPARGTSYRCTTQGALACKARPATLRMPRSSGVSHKGSLAERVGVLYVSLGCVRSQSAPRLATLGSGHLQPSSLATDFITSSQNPHIRRLAILSYTVRCNPMITKPSPREWLNLSADACGTWSAFMPQSEVPNAMHRFARSAHATSHSSKSRRSVSSIIFTWFLLSPHAPCISFNFACGKPAFCARRSWFCCTQLPMRPRSSKAASA
mmetsp:Transcript_15453/g.42512  ORF Transcript_15453/g.42512 Transcript_15453/m.42512 type:complete len:218 (+) Transcript_15453:2-655(+)